MAQDKFTATWVSHSSITDFLGCPRAYFLKNVYKDPKTGHKISLMAPPLALGQAVHEVVESLSVLPVDKRFDESLIEKFDVAWKKVSGKKGGFLGSETELTYKAKGEGMIRRVIQNPGPLKKLAVKIGMNLPQYWLSEEDNIILCGKIDWLEYVPEEDGVRIIDFKTGKNDENPDSLQLPIYLLLATHTQSRPVLGAAYWYLERSDALEVKELPEVDEAEQKVLKIAKQVSLARKLNRFPCPHQTGCRYCKPLEAVVRGEGEFVGLNDYGQDLYILAPSSKDNQPQEMIL